MTPDQRHQQTLELRVLRGAALAYQAQTDVSAGREPTLVDGKLPSAYLREQVRELALHSGSILHLLAELDQAMHHLNEAEMPPTGSPDDRQCQDCECCTARQCSLKYCSGRCPCTSD